MILVVTSPASKLHGPWCSQTETVGPQNSRVPDHPPRPAYLKLDKWASDKKDGAQLKAGTSQTPRGQHSSRTSEVLLATLKIQG